MKDIINNSLNEITVFRVSRSACLLSITIKKFVFIWVPIVDWSFLGQASPETKHQTKWNEIDTRHNYEATLATVIASTVSFNQSHISVAIVGQSHVS